MGWKFWKREPNPMDGARPEDGNWMQDGARIQDGGRVQDSVPAGAFVLPVQDVFSIKGRGTVVTGEIVAGRVQVGDQVLITRAGQRVATTRVTGIEAFRKTLTTAGPGENVGLMLEGIEKSQVLAGDVISR